jgi:hypothetical protein
MCGWDRAKGRNIQAVETLGKSVVRPSEVRQADLWLSLAPATRMGVQQKSRSEEELTHSGLVVFVLMGAAIV